MERKKYQLKCFYFCHHSLFPVFFFEQFTLFIAFVLSLTKFIQVNAIKLAVTLLVTLKFTFLDRMRININNQTKRALESIPTITNIIITFSLITMKMNLFTHSSNPIFLSLTNS